MHCTSCGREITNDVRYCPNCGAPVQSDKPQSSPPSPSIHPNTASQSVAQQNAAPQHATPQRVVPLTDEPRSQYPMSPPAPRRRRRTGCLVAVILVLAILGGIAYLAAATFGLLAPSDLGVSYTEADYQSASKKIGTEITFEGKSGSALRSYTQELKRTGTKLNVNDYNWQHSDFQEKAFELTSAEATALVNEIAPAFYWFEKQQIKVGSNGQVEASGTLLLGKAMDELFPSYKAKVPFPILPQINLSAAGGISISENRLTLSAREFKTGPIQGITPQMLNENATLAESLYKSVPGLIIHKLEITSTGKIAVAALIPQKTVVTRK